MIQDPKFYKLMRRILHDSDSIYFDEKTYSHDWSPNAIFWDYWNRPFKSGRLVFEPIIGIILNVPKNV